MNSYIVIINNKLTNEKYIHNTNLIIYTNIDEDIQIIINYLKLSNPYLEYQKVDDKLEYIVYENVNVVKKGWVYNSILNQKSIKYVLELVPVILSNIPSPPPFIEEIEETQCSTISIPSPPSFIEEIEVENTDSIPTQCSTIYIPTLTKSSQCNQTQTNIEQNSEIIDKWISTTHISKYKPNKEMCYNLDLISLELKDILTKPNYGLRKRR